MTQVQSSAEKSKQWRHETNSRCGQRTRVKILPTDDFAVTVLRLVYRNLLPRLTRSAIGGQLKMKRPSYESNISRSHEFMIQVGEDLGLKPDEWRELVADNEASSISDWKRIERGHLEDAAAEVISVVRGLPEPVREVVERRAVGLSWQAIAKSLPTRALFSIKDDWERGLKELNLLHAELLGRFR